MGCGIEKLAALLRDALVEALAFDVSIAARAGRCAGDKLSGDEVLGEVGDGAGVNALSENVVADDAGPGDEFFHPKNDVSLDPPGDLGFDGEFESYDSSN